MKRKYSVVRHKSKDVTKRLYVVSSVSYDSLYFSCTTWHQKKYGKESFHASFLRSRNTTASLTSGYYS